MIVHALTSFASCATRQVRADTCKIYLVAPNNSLVLGSVQPQTDEVYQEAIKHAKVLKLFDVDQCVVSDALDGRCGVFFAVCGHYFFYDVRIRVTN